MSGVQHRTVAEDDGGLRLDRWLKRHYPALRHGQMAKLIRTGQVRIDGHRAKASDRIESGQTIRLPPLPPPVPATAGPPVSPDLIADLRRRILYEDEAVLVLDKPAGLAVQGGKGTRAHVDAALPALSGRGDALRLVHRLDKDTSGVLLLARGRKAAAALTKAFRERDDTLRKLYWGIVVGAPRPRQGRIDARLAKRGGAGERMEIDPDDGARAITDYATLDRAHDRAALLALWPRTGRTHQLRAHCAAIGTPILGDGKYGGPDAFLPGTGHARQVHLHAQRLSVPHPRGGVLDIEAPPPPHLVDALDRLGLAAPPADEIAALFAEI